MKTFRNRVSTRVALFAALLILLVLAVTTVSAAHHVETVIQFDPNAGQLPEGVTVDKTGNVYVSLAALGQLLKVEPGSNTTELFGTISGLQPAAGDIGLLGLAVDAPGNVYGAVFSPVGGQTGVWKFDRDTGAAARLPGTEQITFPNAVAFDKRGNMYVTDTVAGAVWRVSRSGAVEPWIVDGLLAGDGSAGFPFPLGANGIAIRHNTVYVGVTETGNLVTIPILPDGTAGQPAVLANVGTAVDGIALDVHGNVYVAAVIGNMILRVSADGASIEPLAGLADGLDAPSSIAFGSGNGERQSLYAVNFSIAVHAPGDPGFPDPPNPALVKIDAGVPGLPQP